MNMKFESVKFITLEWLIPSSQLPEKITIADPPEERRKPIFDVLMESEASEEGFPPTRNLK